MQHRNLAQVDKCQYGIEWTGKMVSAGFKFFGYIFAQGVELIGTQIHKNVSQPQNKPQVPSETKIKWNKVKVGTSAAASLSVDLYHSYIQPMTQKGVQYGKKIGNQMESSENSKVRYAKDLITWTGQALFTVGKGVFQGTREIGGQIGVQTKRIVSKKYGDDYVNTFLKGQQVQQKERKNEPIPAYFGQRQVDGQQLLGNLNKDEGQTQTQSTKTPDY